MNKPEALFLADELEAPLGTIIGAELHRRATKELRRLHATVQAREEEIETHSAAVYEATRLLSEVRSQRDALLEALTAALPQLIGKPSQLARAAIALCEGPVVAVKGEKT